MSRRIPKLTRAILKDEDALHAALDEVLRSTPYLGDLTRTVVRSQERLRRRLKNEEWEAYLTVEETTNIRNTAMLEAVAAWAFRQGLRCRATR